ncbi:MAG TPA: hypothetical protein VMJ66_09680, partial [Geobacteraceae bacterium]|nr:hypothetical protein [Geobacteraceae bacterium]
LRGDHCRIEETGEGTGAVKPAQLRCSTPPLMVRIAFPCHSQILSMTMAKQKAPDARLVKAEE